MFDGIANRKCVSFVVFLDRNQETFDMLKCAFVSISMVKFVAFIYFYFIVYSS